MATTAQLEALETAIIEGFTKSARAKRVEFGDQAVTHASRLDLEAARKFLARKEAGAAGRSRFAVASFRSRL